MRFFVFTAHGIGPGGRFGLHRKTAIFRLQPHAMTAAGACCVGGHRVLSVDDHRGTGIYGRSCRIFYNTAVSKEHTVPYRMRQHGTRITRLMPREVVRSRNPFVPAYLCRIVYQNRLAHKYRSACTVFAREHRKNTILSSLCFGSRVMNVLKKPYSSK